MHASPILLQQICKQQPLGLVFDIDGTLSPIVSTPDEAFLHPEVRPLLEQVKEQAHVAIITGRTVESGATMVNVDGLTYIGSHGIEWCDDSPSSHPVEIVPEALSYIDSSNYLLDMLEQNLSDLQGILVERKRVGGSVHYRCAPDPESARQKIWTLLEEPARRVNMRLSEGKRVIEVKPSIAVDKGHALRRFVERFKLKGIVFAGDDRTDLDAVKELVKLRKEGLVTLAIVVQHIDTLPALLKQADVVVQGVDGMVELLRKIVKCLKPNENLPDVINLKAKIINET